MLPLYNIAVEHYTQNKHILASYSDGTYTTAIVGMGDVQWVTAFPEVYAHPGASELVVGEIKGIMLHFKHDLGPVPQGRWMDWPEPHWNLTDAEYEAMPLETRAWYECREQVRYWLPTQFDVLANHVNL